MIFVFGALGFTILLLFVIVIITVIIIMLSLNDVRKSEKAIRRKRRGKYSNRYNMFKSDLDEVNKSLVVENEEFYDEKISKSRVQFVLQSHYDAAIKELWGTKDTDIHHKLVFMAAKEELENVASELGLVLYKRKNNKR